MVLKKVFAVLSVGAVVAVLSACTTEGVATTKPSTDLVAGESGQPSGQGVEEGSTSADTVAAPAAALTPGAANLPTGAAESAEDTQAAASAPKPGEAARPSTAPKLAAGAPGKPAPVSRTISAAMTASAEMPRPGSPAYRCGGGRTLLIENRRSSVVMQDPDGQNLTLPASPAGQTNRYGKKPYALVLEGNEALFMKPGKSPYTCKR